MSIKLVEFKKKKPGTRYDSDRRVYIGYKIDVWINKKRCRDGIFPTREKAEKHIEDLKNNGRRTRAGLRPEIGRVPRVSELLDRRLRSLTKTPEAVRGRRVFREFREAIAIDPPVTEIRKSHFQKYINARLTTGVKQASVSREFAMVRTAFNMADELFPEELEDFTPPRLVRKQTKRRAHINRHVVTLEEMTAVADHLYDRQETFATRIARMWQIAWYLGLRYSETLKLEKKRFNLKARVIEATRFKTDDLTKFVELPDELCEILRSAIADSSDEKYIFPHSTVYPNRFYELLSAGVRVAGLDYGRTRPEQVSFHSLRHSFVTRAAELADLATTGSLSAHSDATMIALYSHSSEAKRRELMIRLYSKNNGFAGDGDLKEIFEKTSAGKMDFEQFKRAVLGAKTMAVAK